MTNFVVRHQQRYRIAKRLKVTFTCTKVGEDISTGACWDPSVPQLNGKLLRRYQAARHAFFSAVKEKFDTSLIVVDPATEGEL